MSLLLGVLTLNIFGCIIVDKANENVVNINDFGAKADDNVDDSRSIQAAIEYAFAKKLDVYIPNGTYIVSRTDNPGKAFCLNLKPDVDLIGESKKSVLKLASNQIAYTRILYIEDSYSNRIYNLTFDGNKLQQPLDSQFIYNEHMHCIFINGSRDIIIEKCNLINSGGDGLTIRGSKKNKAQKVDVLSCYFNFNQRNGISIGGGYENLSIQNCYFDKYIDDSPIDSEPDCSECNSVRITDNKIYTLSSIVTLGARNGFASNYVITRNEFISTGLHMVRAKNVLVTHNSFKNFNTDVPVFFILYDNDSIKIENNKIETNQKTVFLTATKGGTPENIFFTNNNILSYNNKEEVFLIQGPNHVRFIQNNIIVKQFPPCIFRINPNYPMKNIEIRNNKIIGFKGKILDYSPIKSRPLTNLIFKNNQLK